MARTAGLRGIVKEWGPALAVTLLVGFIVLVDQNPTAVARLFCDKGLEVHISNSDGEDRLSMPSSGIVARASLAGEPHAVTLSLHVRQDDGPWQHEWDLEAPSGRDIFFLPTVTDGTQARVVAKSSESGVCAAESNVLRAQA